MPATAAKHAATAFPPQPHQWDAPNAPVKNPLLNVMQKTVLTTATENAVLKTSQYPAIIPKQTAIRSVTLLWKDNSRKELLP